MTRNPQSLETARSSATRRRTGLGAGWLLAVCGLAAVASCSSGPTCTTDAQCPGTKVCAAGACILNTESLKQALVGNPDEMTQIVADTLVNDLSPEELYDLESLDWDLATVDSLLAAPTMQKAMRSAAAALRWSGATKPSAPRAKENSTGVAVQALTAADCARFHQDEQERLSTVHDVLFQACDFATTVTLPNGQLSPWCVGKGQGNLVPSTCFNFQGGGGDPSLCAAGGVVLLVNDAVGLNELLAFCGRLGADGGTGIGQDGGTTTGRDGGTTTGRDGGTTTGPDGGTTTGGVEPNDPCGIVGYWRMTCPAKQGCGPCSADTHPASTSYYLYPPSGIDFDPAVASTWTQPNNSYRTLRWEPWSCTLTVEDAFPGCSATASIMRGAWTFGARHTASFVGSTWCGRGTCTLCSGVMTSCTMTYCGPAWGPCP